MMTRRLAIATDRPAVQRTGLLTPCSVVLRLDRADPAPIFDRCDRPVALRLRRGGPDPDAHHARRRQDQGDRQGHPPPEVADRRQPRAVRRAQRPARPRPDVRRRHPGQRRPRLAAPARQPRESRRRPGTSPSSPTGRLEERHAAEPVYALLKRAYELLDAGMAPGRVARWYEMHLADELGVRPEVDRCVECDRVLEVDGRFRWVPPLGGVLCERCPGPPHERTGLTLDGAEAAQGLPAPGRRGARRAAPGRPSRARSGERDARLHPARPRARRPIARLPRRDPDARGGRAGARHEQAVLAASAPASSTSRSRSTWRTWSIGRRRRAADLDAAEPSRPDGDGRAPRHRRPRTTTRPSWASAAARARSATSGG